MVGAITPSFSAMMQARSSTAPVPPIRCPCMDFVDEIISRSA
jgi:hypothetical protein